ncbi:hypothetical protein [Tritonibacter mobilis]|uniref:hypothetical protein n=1 Tax=Tritonibacter mobilis TaxID=379347 RepID=UPI0008068C30|nr:hypothetical protein [Tritonibacter mobilis]GLP87072.1 hypothetical protein GCM10007921_26320 [Tritonibacter mobilis]SDW49545.1 hypothetical protein SAMN05444385_102406 [Tritonibacter mobilis]
MATEPVVTPGLNAEDHVLVDWLELVAFFNEFRTARLDELDAAIEEQFETVEDGDPDEDTDALGDDDAGNIARADAEKERVRERIENEVDFRLKDCENAYPFVLGEDAEELVLVEDWQDERFTPYLTCLISTHLTKNSLFDFEVADGLIHRLRNRVFQVLSTFAMAGLARGSAASIGWPRADKADIIETLRRAEARGAGIKVKDEPGEYTPPHEKDGGVDVAAWHVGGRPPPLHFFFAQVASGHDWRGKTVRILAEIFEENYLEYSHRGNVDYATLLPFRVVDNALWMRENKIHGVLLDRTRLPKHAVLGQGLSRNGVEFDEAENMPQVLAWLNDFRATALG